jgi:hypothetical protein
MIGTLLTLFLLVVLVAVTALLVLQGLWRSLLAFFNVLTAASIATAWFAPLATLLDRYLPSYTYLLDFLSAWLIFCLVLAILRATTDFLAPTRVEFPPLVERIGVGIPAFLAGWIVMAFTAATLHTAPIPRDYVQPTPEARMFLGLSPDRKWLSWVRNASRSGPFSRANFDPEADFILRYADRRLKLEAEQTLRVSAK